MFLSTFLFSRTPFLAGLVGAALMVAGPPARAQQPLGAVSKFDRANSPAVVGPASSAPAYAVTASPLPSPLARTPAVLPPPAAGPLVVTVRYPASSELAYVTLRGPDGAIQRYALESGPESIQTRTVIVRQGETASFRFAVAAQPK
jgi:hypothetical protein